MESIAPIATRVPWMVAIGIFLFLRFLLAEYLKIFSNFFYLIYQVIMNMTTSRNHGNLTGLTMAPILMENVCIFFFFSFKNSFSSLFLFISGGIPYSKRFSMPTPTYNSVDKVHISHLHYVGIIIKIIKILESS